MAEYIEVSKAIEILERMKAERQKKSCSKASLDEANAIGYAIAIIKKLPRITLND